MKYINSIGYKSGSYLIAMSLLFGGPASAEYAHKPDAHFTLSGIDGSSSYNETVCPGFNMCFDVFLFGGNQTQKAVMFWDKGIEDAQFSVTEEDMPTGHFCWTPDLKDARNEPYVFHVTVDNGIESKVFIFSLTVPMLRAEIKTTDVTCSGNSDGSATAIVTGGSGNYHYQWSNGEEAGSSVTGLGEGNITVHVMDDFGCEAIASDLVLSPKPLVLQALSDPISFADLGGQAEVIADGGTMPYSYSWIPGDGSTGKMAQLPSGVYTAIVTDANGCTAYMPVNISTLMPDNKSESREIQTITDAQESVLIYPNPANEQFTIKNISEATVNVTMMNSIGQDIYETIRIPANLSVVIPMDDLGPGIYLVKVEQNKNIETIRVVKE